MRSATRPSSDPGSGKYLFPTRTILLNTEVIVMPKGSKFYTSAKVAAAAGTPLADITDVNNLPTDDPNKR